MKEPHSTVIFRDAPGRLPRAAFRKLAREAERLITRGRGFTVLVSGDAELRRLNRQFLGRDYATDVLSFPAGVRVAKSGDRQPSEKTDGASPRFSLGEIAISAERAREQAREYGHTLREELGILLVHGVLHLQGMDHEKDGGAMARAERRHRRRLGLPAGLIERARR